MTPELTHGPRSPKIIRRCGLAAFVPIWLCCTAGQAAVTTIDDAGREVSLPGPAGRIVSLAPHITELLFSAGAGAKVVGAVQWSDFPEAASRIPRVGDTYSVDLERIVEMRPDLIVAWKSGNSQLTVRRLLDLGLPVFISEPRSLDDIGESIRRLGELAGTADFAPAEHAAYMQRLQALRSRNPGGPAVSVFYQVWDEPIFTVNGEHVISEVIGLCGGRNVFAALPSLSTQIGREAVLAADPDVIIASGADAERPAWLDNWNQWPSMTAVRHGTLFHVAPHLLQRHTVRILDGAEQVCTMLNTARNNRM